MEQEKPAKSRTKFVELAEKRVSKAIKDIRLIGNLSNRSNYSYTEEDVRKIVKALKDEIDALKARFEAKGSDSKPVFKL
jgi:transcription elongation GreA/GreB family factor